MNSKKKYVSMPKKGIAYVKKCVYVYNIQIYSPLKAYTVSMFL